MHMTAAIRIIALALAGFCLAMGAAHAAPCQLGKIADIPVQWDDNHALASVSINGHDVLALIDSGAQTSSLYRSTADALGLRYSVIPGLTARGFGGVARVYQTDVDRLGFGQAAAFHVHMRVLDWSGRGRAGMLIGENVLSSHDAEFAFSEGRVSLFDTHGDCRQTALAYWDSNWSVTGMLSREAGESVRVNVTVNGQTLRALLDTGSPTSLITRAAAERAGVTPESDGVTAAGHTTGIGGGSLQSWRARFTAFQIADETINNPELRVVDTSTLRHGPDFDMVLGADFFRTHRVLFAYSQNKVYFSYLGGHVFQIVGPAELPDEHGEPDQSGDPAPPVPSLAPASGPSAPH